jgi:transcription antitermination factor NusB
MRDRTMGREAALIRLYQLDLARHPGGAALSPHDLGTARDLRIPEVDLTSSAASFALELLRGVQEHHESIDDRIRSASENWELRRMPVIDRNILRLAVFELLFRQDIPPKVSINEAIELGKRYSTERSGAFINGILDHIKNHVAPQES